MGSVFLIAIVVIVLVALAALVWPWFFIPAAVVVVFAVIAGPIMAWLKRGQAGGARGVPTTEEASYEPVEQPEDTPAR